MGYQDIDLARLKIKEARQYGMTSQRVHRELADGSHPRWSKLAINTVWLTKMNAFLSLSIRNVIKTYPSRFRDALTLYWSHSVLHHTRHS